MRRIDYKWVMLALVSSAYFLAQGTRQIYNSVLPQIKSDFLAYGVTDTQLGIVGSAFALAFGIAIPFAGLAADFFRRKWMIVAGMAIFSLGILLSGFASGLGMLGWMSANFSMRTGFASLAVSAAIGAVVILVARCVTFERDRI